MLDENDDSIPSAEQMNTETAAEPSAQPQFQKMDRQGAAPQAGKGAQTASKGNNGTIMYAMIGAGVLVFALLAILAMKVRSYKNLPESSPRPTERGKESSVSTKGSRPEKYTSKVHDVL